MAMTFWTPTLAQIVNCVIHQSPFLTIKQRFVGIPLDKLPLHRRLEHRRPIPLQIGARPLQCGDAGVEAGEESVELANDPILDRAVRNWNLPIENLLLG
jgi:hypothetical protein